MKIDWEFIAKREGRKLEGYVPNAKTSHSGVTIGIGFDLGQRTEHDLAGLPGPLVSKLKPYLGVRGADAVALLEDHPLTITDSEADQLDELAEFGVVGAVAGHYSRAAGSRFEDLPGAAQTVLASVAYQYGSPWEKCPRFWNAIVQKNWDAAEHELRHFGDAYQPRHDLEADYLRDNLNKGEA